MELRGKTIASTTRAWRVRKTSHPPTYYLPGDAFFAEGMLRETSGSSWCQWVGFQTISRYNYATAQDTTTVLVISPTGATPSDPVAGLPQGQAVVGPDGTAPQIISEGGRMVGMAGWRITGSRPSPNCVGDPHRPGRSQQRSS